MAELVPHRGPLLWLDAVRASGDGWLEAEAEVRPDHLLSDGEAVGGWAGLEYMAQAIAAYAGVQARARGEEVRLGFLVSTRRYSCRWPRLPIGTRLQIRVCHEYETENGLSVFACRLASGDDEVASATVTVFQPPDPAAFLEGHAA
jgi:predicted hotdog family 3-hydroxylacyl-ACP dehydratase